MWAVRKKKKEVGFELEQVPIPTPKPDEVLLKVLACSLCGTDVHVHDWDPPFCEGRLTPPVTTGHEVCGEVVEVGSEVTEFKVGDLASAESHLPCKSQEARKHLTCAMCDMGNGHICEYVKFFSVDVDGFLAEYATAPANILWRNPPDIEWEIGAMQESLGNSVYTVEVCDVKDKDVAVFGLGPTGLNAVACAKQMGAKQIIAVAGTQAHIDLARQMGATTVINRHESDPVEEIRRLTNGRGAHAVLEMSGSGFALKSAFQAVMTTGIVSILGLYAKPVELDWSKLIVMKDITVRGIYGRIIWRTWELTAKLLREGMNVKPVITHRFYSLEDYPKAIELMHEGKCGKCVFFPNGKPPEKN